MVLRSDPCSAPLALALGPVCARLWLERRRRGCSPTVPPSSERQQRSSTGGGFLSLHCAAQGSTQLSGLSR